MQVCVNGVQHILAHGLWATFMFYPGSTGVGGIAVTKGLMQVVRWKEQMPKEHC